MQTGEAFQCINYAHDIIILLEFLKTHLKLFSCLRNISLLQSVEFIRVINRFLEEKALSDEVLNKTGFFADQRDNRRTLAEFCAEARMLDLCCNSGGFGLYARTIGGAREVTGVDLDEEILGIAEQNARLNKVRARFIQADIFAWLRDVAVNNRDQYDVVVLDPAKMTRDREQVIPALKKYLDMNKLALAAVKPGGILLSCSCTGLISEEQFLDMLRRAAFYANRTLQVIKVSGAGPDHPWLAHVPESRYLKAAFCRVE